MADLNNNARYLVRPTTKPVATFAQYEPRYPTIAQILMNAVQKESTELVAEHIGSTAVPGCAGKGIIDIMLVYPNGQPGVAHTVLEKLGFRPQGPEFRHRGSFPEEHLVRIGELDYDDETFRSYVHAVPRDSPEVERFRTFRDRLRAEPETLLALIRRREESRHRRWGHRYRRLRGSKDRGHRENSHAIEVWTCVRFIRGAKPRVT